MSTETQVMEEELEDAPETEGSDGDKEEGPNGKWGIPNTLDAATRRRMRRHLRAAKAAGKPITWQEALEKTKEAKAKRETSETETEAPAASTNGAKAKGKTKKEKKGASPAPVTVEEELSEPVEELSDAQVEASFNDGPAENAWGAIAAGLGDQEETTEDGESLPF